MPCITDFHSQKSDVRFVILEKIFEAQHCNKNNKQKKTTNKMSANFLAMYRTLSHSNNNMIHMMKLLNMY